MPLDDPSRKRQRQAHAPTLFVERRRLAVVCRLHARILGDDENGGGAAGAHLDAAFGDYRAGTGPFPQDRPENRAECGPEPRCVARHVRPVLLAANLQPYVAIASLAHLLGHFSDERKGVEGLAVQRDEAGVEDRKSTRLNSSHTVISYAVFCLKKKIK